MKGATVMEKAIPYLLLALLVSAYLSYRRKKMGRVTLKVERILFSRANTDLFLSLALFAAVCALFIRYDLTHLTGAAPGDRAIRWDGNILFYMVLFLVFAWRQTEKPALRECGVSSPRGNWRWEKIVSYRWTGNTVMLSIAQGKKTRTEIWPVPPQQRKELAAALKNALREVNRKRV